MIQEGEQWQTRGGEIYTIFSIGADKEYPIVAINNKTKQFEKFSREGYSVNKSFPTGKDLVERL
jgi:hypothetical protein